MGNIDINAISLLKDFIKEKLGGNIKNLRGFDFSTLKEDRKYGGNFIERTPIVKAIMSLAFADVWDNLSFDSITRGRFECDIINKYQNLFGINMCDQYFKGLREFNPTSAQHQRALKIAHMSYSVGNFWVLPSMPSIASRVLDNRYRYYMDKFLQSIYAIMTQGKRVDKTLQDILSKNKFMDKYQGEEGFGRFVKEMILDDFVDYYGKPEDIFMFVWSAMKDLDRETYFKAVDQYCTFCESFIPKRADRIIAKLEQALAQSTSTRSEQTTTKEKALTRYSLAYDYMLQCLDFAMNDKKIGLPIMADKQYFMTLYRKMGLVPDGFVWDDFKIDVVSLDENHPAIVYTFPRPLKQPEAIYGAIVINHIDKVVEYYTLEKGRTEDKWALGFNTPKERTLIGLYEITPTKEKFYELIMGAARFYLGADVNAVLKLSANYQLLKTLPEDPTGCVNYGSATSSSETFIQAFPIPYSSAMDFGNSQSIIDGIHNSLADNQALIEVNTGMTRRSYHYAFSIIKTKMEQGVQYFLLLQIMYGHVVLNIKAFFSEKGMTGIRDATVWELKCREGVVSHNDDSQWAYDPYDKDYNHSYQMNLSEKEEYDKMFPEHPLTQCREFAKYVIEQSYLWKQL